MTNKPELPDDRLDKIIAETSATIAERQAYSNTDGGSIEVNTALFLGAMRELRELRRSYLALRGEIEDVQAQLYEAENRNEANAAMLQAGNSPVTPDCWCRTCRPVTMSDMRFVVCPDCGNKRCPHANDHRNDCTGSNVPGQAGSAYPAAPQQEVTSARVHPARNK
jgi:hypothetical protein